LLEAFAVRFMEKMAAMLLGIAFSKTKLLNKKLFYRLIGFS
jgi:hypothetical protein